jgi:hypothetical protein
MARVVFGLLLLVAFTLYVRHQQKSVMQKLLAPTTNPWIGNSKFTPASTRHKCLICGGTGRAPSFNFTVPAQPRENKPCSSCNGTGWVEDMFAPVRSAPYKPAPVGSAPVKYPPGN